jgi:chromosome segregation ATPase
MPPKGSKTEEAKVQAAMAKKAAEAKKLAPKKIKKAKDEEDASEKIPKVDQPDRAAMDEKIKKVTTALEAFQKKMQDVTKRIGERSTGKEEFFSKKTEIRSRLDEVQGRIDALMGKKDEMYKEIDGAKAAEREAKDSLKKMKGAMPFGSEEDIDKRIADIEFSMWTSTMSLKDEKKALLEISELKRNKPKVSNLKKMEAAHAGKTPGASVEPLREQTKLIAGNIKEIREEKRLISAEYAALNEERQKQMENMPELFEERQALNGKIQEKIAERNAIRDEHRVQERAYNEYLNEVRKVRAERSAVQRNERNAEWDEKRKERALEQLEEQPHIAEITLIEQTIQWCNTITSGGKKKEEVKVEKKDTSFNNPDGAMILLKKDDRSEEMYFAPTKGKKAKKGAGAKDAKGSGTNIKHNVGTFQLFDKLKIDAPVSTDDIPAVVEKLEAQMVDYQEKVKHWELNREAMKQKIIDGVKDEKKEEEKKEEEEKKDEDA